MDHPAASDDTNKKELDLALSTLLTEKAKFEAMKAEFNKRAQSGRAKVVLNIGGQLFTTSRQTLLVVPDSFFHSMLEFEPDGNGQYFLDRNPALFSLLLDYLRSGHPSFANLRDDQLDALKVEFDYFGIDAPWPLVTHFHESSILEGRIMKRILEAFFPKLKRAQLLYSASVHGWGVPTIRARGCGEKPNTLVLIEAHGSIFGGYASRRWCHSDEGYSFLFSLSNPTNTFVGTKFLGEGCFDIIADSFGDEKILLVGEDIEVNIAGELCDGSYARPGTYFAHPLADADKMKATPASKRHFCGYERFRATNIEVYELTL